MALTQSFSINTPAQINPNAIFLVDTSTGVDANVASRQILIYKVDQTLFTPAIPWAYNLVNILLSILTQDLALNIVVNWLDSGGNIIYSASQIYAFTNFSELFYYQLTQAQTGQPLILVDQDYYKNKMLLRVELNSAKQAIETGLDIFSAQGCISRAVYMCQQHQLFFNL